MVEYAIERGADVKLSNESSNLVNLGELWPITDTPFNSSDDFEAVTTPCVGEPEYCNHTEEEYNEMLNAYIFPTPGEWVLIGCHSLVFLIGLVSNVSFFPECFNVRM